jgi:hypothetical protein
VAVAAQRRPKAGNVGPTPQDPLTPSTVSEFVSHRTRAANASRHPALGADIETILIRSKFKAAIDGRDEATAADIEAVVKDFVPPSYPLEIELQNLVAVQECTSRELLPPNFQKLERDEVTRRIRELKVLLEER